MNQNMGKIFKKIREFEEISSKLYAKFFICVFKNTKYNIFDDIITAWFEFLYT